MDLIIFMILVKLHGPMKTSGNLLALGILGLLRARFRPDEDPVPLCR